MSVAGCLIGCAMNDLRRCVFAMPRVEQESATVYLLGLPIQAVNETQDVKKPSIL
jgi:hypothetical protein